VISLNLKRRHLSADQKAAIAIAILPFLEREAEERQRATRIKAGKPPTVGEKIPTPALKGRARDQAAKIVGVNPRYVSDFRKIQATKPELAEKIRGGKKKLRTAVRELKEHEQALVLKKKAKEYRAEEGMTLLVGDFRKVCETIAPNSVDLILTDPPYSKQYLPLYGSLAEVASKLLKKGGSLLVMGGQSYVPEIIELMKPHLNYCWLVAYLTPGGQSAQLWKKKVNTFWKPVLWFINGTDEYHGKWVGDVVKSAVNDNSKEFHKWGQSISGMTELVEKFSMPNDLILDPFLGGGTTAVVAKQLKRRFIGIDVDPTAIETTKGRLG
jgi:site-specific DNA-methyltransferase (adenine-specific)